ncbi:MAG: glutamate--tRNA ligase [Thermodesulfobacteriota bacterium]
MGGGEGKVRTRFAPSPTGLLHVGSARTALYNWLSSKSLGGDFLLRIEDTDLERSRKEYEEGIYIDLNWLGLAWDGEPCRQSERLDLYKAAAEDLVREGKAYYCYCTKERLAELKKSQQSAGIPSRYDRRCLEINKDKIPNDVKPVVRFHVPDGTIEFDDKLRGLLSFDGSDISDFIIIGSDGVASYNFAAAVDDGEMEITDVIRGDDHISNTPRQILVLNALGKRTPNYMHISLVTGGDGKPLGKRDSSTTITALREAGYEASAVLNAVARVGWAPGSDTLLSLTEMSKAFKPERLSTSSAEFDLKSLAYYDKLAIKKMTAEEVTVRVENKFSKHDRKLLERAIVNLKDDVSSIRELRSIITGLSGEIILSDAAEEAVKDESAKKVLKIFIEEIEKLDGEAIDAETFKGIIKGIKEALDLPMKLVMIPVRAAVTGMTAGASLDKIIGLMKRAEILKRVKNTIG